MNEVVTAEELVSATRRVAEKIAKVLSPHGKTNDFFVGGLRIKYLMEEFLIDEICDG